MTNTINLESSLFGLDRNLSRDCNPQNNYKDVNIPTSPIEYPVCSPFTDQSRVTNPAWWYRDLEQPNWDYLHLNPQENTCMSFQNNLSTRILEKDNYVTKIPCFTYNMIDNTQNLFTK
jgi:hypothetical protein